MTADKLRRLPRFSLITLVVAVNVAGVLVVLNIFERDHVRAYQGHGVRGSHVPFKVIGFPLFHRERLNVEVAPPPERSVGFLILDVVFALASVGIAAFLTELLVRKFRKAKRHDG